MTISAKIDSAEAEKADQENPLTLELIRLRDEVEEKKAALQKEIVRRRITERALRKSEEKYRSTIESFQDVYFRADLKGRITVISPSVYTEGGYSPHAVVGEHSSKFFASQDEFHNFQKVLRQSGQVNDHELQLRRQDGTVLTASLNAHFIRNPHGRPQRIVGVLRNISARKQAQEQIRKYQETLELMVAERTRKLEETKQELVNKAMEAGRAQLSAMVLHNIGNAITPVNVQIEALSAHPSGWIGEYLRRCYEELIAHQRELTTFINEDPRGQEVFAYLGELIDAFDAHRENEVQVVAKIESAVAYIAEILSLQQAYAAHERENRELTELNMVIEDALKMQAASLDKRCIEIRKNLEENLPRLLIDKNRLMQVVVNFIKNSYEAIDELNKARSAKWIAISTFSGNGQVGLRIRDSGVGIPTSQLETIFDFGHSSKGSSGFGLHYCKMFVEANRGHLEIRSSGPGRGTKVTVRFESRERKGP